MSSELVFVTGASGFLGSHVMLQLLEKGHRVRAAARGAKADHLRSSYATYGDRLEVVKITDIAHDKFPEALAGVDGIIHIASPLPGRADPAEILANDFHRQAAVEGTLNVVVQGEKAGVKRMVVTSSIATVINPNNTFTDQDWNPVTREEALTGGNEMETYSASKTFAEMALWEWADKHPHVEVTTLNPTFFYGPFTPHFPLPAPDFGAISTNLLVYNLLFKDGVPPYHARYIDVRDVAKAHILALNSRSTAEVGRKRIVFSSPHGWPWQKTLDFIAERRPALRERFIAATPEDTAPDVLPMDFKRVEEVLGMKTADFYPIEETMLETFDALIQAEDQWRSAGHPIKTPPSF
ncbi:Epimerase domain-containing protein [Mycena venus]|uniref:Epimerase domain-containing protein n=1 Tax=Mycena venus TaxID=2733690 RepID=A0A8H6YN05_9AGAR|nr:Epimerase domain-containing protein [Mycena venus]